MPSPVRCCLYLSRKGSRIILSIAVYKNARLKCVRHKGYSSDAAVELDNLQIFPSRLPLRSSSESSARRREKGGKGELQVVHSGFKASSHCPLSDSSPPSTWPVSARQTSAILCSSRSAHVTLEEFGEGERLFLAFRSCGKSDVYILCLQTCYDNVILKSWSLETWLCVFFLPFSKSCADFFHT